MASLSVSISSLLCTPGKEAETFSLSTKVYDSTHRVRDWKLRLAQAYNAAGLSRKSTHPRCHRIDLPSCDDTVSIIHILSSTEVISSPYYPEQVVKSMPTPFNARGLLERYKDHVWMEKAQLERVSICKVGFRRLGMGKLQEVASVPL